VGRPGNPKNTMMAKKEREGTLFLPPKILINESTAGLF
jgi:hypothetical protein